MKKLLFVLAIGAFAASCTDTTSDATTTPDTTVVVPEATLPSAVDSTVIVDSTKADSTVVK